MKILYFVQKRQIAQMKFFSRRHLWLIKAFEIFYWTFQEVKYFLKTLDKALHPFCIVFENQFDSNCFPFLDQRPTFFILCTPKLKSVPPAHMSLSHGPSSERERWRVKENLSLVKCFGTIYLLISWSKRSEANFIHVDSCRKC